MMERQTIQSRRVGAWANVFVFLIIAVLLGLGGRVVWFKTISDTPLNAAAGSPWSTSSQSARRGTITDRRGRVLATSTLGYRLFVDMQAVPEFRRDTIAIDLARTIDIDPVMIDRKLIERPESRFVVIADPLDEALVADVRRAAFPGVGLQPRALRHYPQNNLAASIIGMVGFEQSGLGGVEYIFEQSLQPVNGRLTVLHDAGRQTLWIDPEDYQPAFDGTTIRLSIDLVIQEYGEQRLRDAVNEFNATGGQLVVFDPTTGELLAMCDVLNKHSDREQFIKDPLRNKFPALARNRCVTDPYEPGSTFKPFIWAVATELGKAHPAEEIPTPGVGVYVTSFGRRIRDSHSIDNATWETVLVQSLNSGMAIVAERMTQQQMQHAVARFGFGRKPNCPLPGASAGLVTSAKKWNDYTHTSVSFGHEIAVTAVQMVRAFGVFARDGTLPPLRITTVHRDELNLEPIHRVLSENVVLQTRLALRRVMTEGTGRRAQSHKYQLFGKSGTPQMPNAVDGGYYEDRYIPSFIAAAPFDEPRIVVLCVINDPDKSIGHWGGVVAGPVVRDVIDFALTYLGVPSDGSSASRFNARR